MKKFTLAVAVATICAAAQASDTAERVGGSPKANFSTDELTIPCVQVQNLSEETEGTFYDIVLKRRGKSWNYELTAAEPEDAVLCQRIADFANFEEDDEPALLAQCEASTGRSRIEVSGKNLEDDDYFVVVSSGETSLESLEQTSVDGEVGFDFDSDSDEVAEGAEAIEADFIVDGTVDVDLFAVGAAADAEPLLSVTASCTADD